ncbi:uncharacterized protein UTRI_10009 [Ustilago trichophora]|uniref:Uncharacterized protein n=1 Tax=Ustilago trichophora TaxID=86804 RepID=A0A5C3DR58_9BASI|nr:uncharacterized protein UTRI_10009 [Ustilago trichophora]
MKIQATLIATCLVIAISASSVAGWWIDNGSKGNRMYNAFCGDNPRTSNTKRVCVTAPASIIKQIHSKTSTFQGYLSSNGRAFVLFPGKEATVINTDTYQMVVDFNQVLTNCARVTFNGAVNPMDLLPKMVCQPGADPVAMPSESSIH